MKLTRRGWLRSLARVAGCAVAMWLAGMTAARAQAVSTTAVQGTVYFANGQPAGGTLEVSWPTFTTAAGQLISAGQTTVTVGADGFVSVNLAPNQGATPAGEYYTAVFYQSDGTVTTQYWVVPEAAQASLAQVQAQVMPAAQAVQAVSKAYVDQTVAQALGSQLLSSGGNLTGPLYLNADPTQPLQAADKHYVDSSFSAALPLSGGTITGPASFSAAVSFGSSVTASSGIGFTGTGAAQTLANLLPGAVSDGANGMTLAGTSAPNASVPKVSPVADIRAYGAKIDGATDIGSALNSAIAVCNTSNGNACTVLLPCAGPNGCYLANGSGVTYSGSNVLHLRMQGTLHPNSTFVLPDDVTLTCDGGAPPQQFQYSGATCQIEGPNVTGAVGTAITTTGSAVTFTPTYTAGSASNFQVGSNISVAGVQTCSATASRTSNGSTSPNTTFTLSSCTDSSGDSEGARTPVSSVITVTGCSDSTFDITGAPVNGQDWPNNQESIYETGATSTATGCTVVGFDDNTFETVTITAVSGSTMTATFAHKHAASDLFGMGAVTFKPNTFNHHDLQDVQITSGGGAALYLDNMAEINLSGDGFIAHSGVITSIAVECAGCWQGSWNKDTFQPGGSFQCYSNCSFSYPYAIRFTQDAARNNGVGGAFTQISNSNISGGIKLDGNGMAGSGGVGPEIGPFVNDVFEQPALAAITVDPRFNFSGPLSVSMEYSSLQDDFIGNVASFVAGTDCCVNGYANMGDLPSFASVSAVLANKYWPFNIAANNTEQITNPASIGPSTGVLSNGNGIMGNFDGANAWMSPAIVPQSTVSMILPISCATCVAITGPDGVANSATEIQTTSGGTNTQYLVAAPNMPTYAGDVVLFGSFCKPGTNQTRWGSNYGFNDMMNLSTTGTDTFAANPGVFSNQVPGGAILTLTNGTWQRCLGIGQITVGDSTSHYLEVNLMSPPSGASDHGNDFYNPWMMVIPGPNNPSYAGVTQQEAVRWAEEVMKGYVPSGASTGKLYANFPLSLQVTTTSISGTSGTAACAQTLQGTMKHASCYLNGYAQTGTAQTYTFPSAFSTTPVLLESGGSCGTYNPSVSATVLTLPANASMTAETCNVVVMGQ